MELLNTMAARVLHRGLRLVHGQIVDDLIEGYNTAIREGQPTGDLFPGAAHARYGAARVRLAQIVWPCPHARFPWQDGYCMPTGMQPLLARP